MASPDPRSNGAGPHVAPASSPPARIIAGAPRERTVILGISAFYHDSAAALLIDGEIIAAAQEERFTRKKADHRFPSNAAAYCLHEAGIGPSELTYVAFYEKPITKFGRLLENYLAVAPAGLRSWLEAIPTWLKHRLWLEDTIRSELGIPDETPVLFPGHHESHAASAFFPSPYESAAILTVDGVGEWSTTTVGRGAGNKVELLKELRYPHSLGLLYSAFTYYTGFKINSGEYKVMGLAPYGEPKYVQAILDEILDLKEDGSLKLDLDFFNFQKGLTMTSEKFHRLLGGPPREPETRLGQREMDLARSVQDVCELAMLRMARHAHELTGEKRLCLAGGVALNCVGNGRILREGPFDSIWIQPAAGDAGGALGAAYTIWHHMLAQPRTPDPRDSMRAAYLGPSFSDDEIEQVLRSYGAVYERMDRDELLDATVDALASEQVVGWFQGRMEFGPRALGARSILGDARSAKMQSVMNLKIKFRESFRPFAPVVLREAVSEYFELDCESPYMLLVAPVREEIRTAKRGDEDELWGIDLLNVPRSTVPAITHVDYSARVQTVDDRNGAYYEVLKRFRERTGCAVLVNTSFNVRGEPIVCRPEEAYTCLMRTEMDLLVMGSFMVRRTAQPEWTETKDWRSEFVLD
ncbi:MAG TPA: carbamoyltransferase [Gemmatimonadaceae bacterium]|nr:carbamoyltransferase [Gemmatimonadaceae bacterium]